MPKINYTTSKLIEVLRLRREGMTLKDIGDKFGQSPQTIKYWVGIAREKEEDYEQWKSLNLK